MNLNEGQRNKISNKYKELSYSDTKIFRISQRRRRKGQDKEEWGKKKRKKEKR